MSRKRKQISPISLIILFFFVAIAAQGKSGAIPGLIILGVIFWAVRSYLTKKPANIQPKDTRDYFKSPVQKSRSLQVEITTSRSASRYEPPPIKNDSKWIPPGHSESILGIQIPDGFLYVGKDSSLDYADPSLINTRAHVSAEGQDVALDPHSGYYGSYSRMTPAGRRTYLQWLSEGRKNPSASIGYVFLAFYALERRILFDGANDTTVVSEIDSIKAEIKRLQGIYGGNNSFRRYSNDFLDYIEAFAASKGAFTDGPATTRQSLKIQLGRKAASGDLISSDLTLAWIRDSLTFSVPNSIESCKKEFEALFKQAFDAKFGSGLKITTPRLRLRASYRAASKQFVSQSYEIVLSQIPDVASSTVAIKKIQALIDQVSAGLLPYARFIRRNPDEVNSLSALLLLPTCSWPESAREALYSLDRRIGTGLVTMTLGALADQFNSKKTLTRERVQALIGVLGGNNIGFEPDVLSGARTPKADDTIVLFRTEHEDSSQRNSGTYRAACVTLDLGCVLASADEKITAAEIRQLTSYIDGLSTLPTAQRQRLRARVKAGISSPPSLASLRTQIERIPESARRHVAHLTAAIAVSDGDVPVSEVKMLERIYKALGVDPGLVHADLHEFATSGQTHAAGQAAPLPTALRHGGKAEPAEFLDPARVAALQADTDKVAALLANVFADEEESAPEALAQAPESDAESSQRLLDLDAEHDVFLRVLMSRPQWSREELSAIASDMELMVEGALEKINEAAFDKLGDGIVEGDDPITINRDLIESIAA